MKPSKSTHARKITQTSALKPSHLLKFWLLFFSGGLAWAFLLLLFNLTSWSQLMRPEEIPQSVQNTYVFGLYLWLAGLLYRFRPVQIHWLSWLREALGAYLFGVGLLLAFWLAFWFNGLLIIRPPQIHLLQCLHALLLGWLIAWIEETVFRGLTLESLSTALYPLGAVMVQAFIYASLHLLHPKYFNLQGLIALGALFAVGTCLGLLRLYRGQLALATGLHAGWVSLSSLGEWSQSLKWQASLWSAHGNPAQGLSALLCFGLLSIYLWHLLPPNMQLWHNGAKRP